MIASDTQRKPVEVDSSQPNRKRREKGHLSAAQEVATVMGHVRSLRAAQRKTLRTVSHAAGHGRERTEDEQACGRLHPEVLRTDRHATGSILEC